MSKSRSGYPGKSILLVEIPHENFTCTKNRSYSKYFCEKIANDSFFISAREGLTS